MQKKQERSLEEEQMQNRKNGVQSQMSATTIYHSLSLFNPTEGFWIASPICHAW